MQQISTRRIQDLRGQRGKGDLLCQRLKFDDTTNSYMHKLVPVLRLKILWDFKMQTGYLIQLAQSAGAAEYTDCIFTER